MYQLPLPLFQRKAPDVAHSGPGPDTGIRHADAHTFPDLPPEQRQPASAEWEWVLSTATEQHRGVIVADSPAAAARAWRANCNAASLADGFPIADADLADEPTHEDPGYIVRGTGWCLLLRLTPTEIERRMSALSARAAARQAACCPFANGARGGATIDYMTGQERAALEYLRLMLPLQEELADAARRRLRDRIAARRPARAHTGGKPQR